MGAAITYYLVGEVKKEFRNFVLEVKKIRQMQESGDKSAMHAYDLKIVKIGLKTDCLKNYQRAIL